MSESTTDAHINFHSTFQTAKQLGYRRVYSGEGEVCHNCKAIGGPQRHLKLCQGCCAAWYCNEACSKANWKKHRTPCKGWKELLSTMNGEERRTVTAVQRWKIKNATWLHHAGQDALLPHADYLTGQQHLLNTHFVMVDLLEDAQIPTGFAVVRAYIAPMEELRAEYTFRGKGDTFQSDVIKGQKDHFEAALGQVIPGVIILALRCQGVLLLFTRPVTRSSLQDAETMKHYHDWEEGLKHQVALNGGMYMNAEGEIGVGLKDVVRESLRQAR